jgi:hypothetical protein
MPLKGFVYEIGQVFPAEVRKPHQPILPLGAPPDAQRMLTRSLGQLRPPHLRFLLGHRLFSAFVDHASLLVTLYQRGTAVYEISYRIGATKSITKSNGVGR